jgi:transposase
MTREKCTPGFWCDREEYQRLTQRYFGLRVLITDRSEWTTAQIIGAYRGQSPAEAAFRDLKDPGMLATRPQFHWTDQITF